MGGYKTCILEIKGEYVYSKLKYEVTINMSLLFNNLLIEFRNTIIIKANVTYFVSLFLILDLI